jgi:glycosyltransferase involved in cell wall biosynthesis
MPVGDVDALAGALLAVLTDKSLRAGLVAAGKEVVQRFTWAESARRHIEIYAALDRHPAPA